MEYQCIHILTKGERRGERCNRNAWFPFFYRCFCRRHAEMYNIPITYEDINEFIKTINLNNSN